jgi:Mg-chelatase subunit ChlD
MRQPDFPGEEIETMEDLTVIDGLQKEAVKERLAMPSTDVITRHDASGLAKDSSFSIQMPEPGAEIAVTPNIVPDHRNVPVVPLPVTGTAIDQLLSEPENAPAKPDERGGPVQDSKAYLGHVEQDLGTKRSAAEESDGPTTVTRGGEAATEKYAKDRLERLAELSDLYKSVEIAGEVLEDDDDKNGTRSRYSRQSEPEGKPSESLHRGDELATSGRDRWGEYVPPVLVDNSKSMKVWDVTSPVPAGLSETSAGEEAFSTFSLHVSDVSFKLARAALAGGQWPEAAKVRIEEFVNAFDYGDPMPTQREKVSCRLEQAVHPFLQQRNLLRISMRTAAAGRSSSTPLRLTFVLDNSGSMERSDRRQTVRRAFALLAQQLKPIDQVTLISFARQPRLLADKVSGTQSQQLLELIADLPSEGGTNIEAALQLAFEKAKEQQTDGAQNRIILLTDGAVNLGDANPASLSQRIATMRVAGIAFDAAGICADGLNDEVLEALTRQGDGRYYLLDSWEAADAGFARQIAGALRPSAKNVKVQVEFNPLRVGRYKLLGFEKHLLNQEDFRNDSVDAAEMAAAEAGVAMYQFEAKPDGEGDVGSVSVRFQDLSTGQMIEHRWPIPYESPPRVSIKPRRPCVSLPRLRCWRRDSAANRLEKPSI